MEQVSRVALFTILLLVISTTSYAYEMKSGTVKKITVNSPMISHRNVMVELQDVNQMCSIASNNESGYFNKTDLPDVFNSFIAVLLTAQASGEPVIVFTAPGAEGCRIDQVQLLNN